MPCHLRWCAVLCIVATTVSGCAQSARSPEMAGAIAPAQSSSEQRFVDSLLARMTLAEKLGQLNQLSGAGDPTGPGGRGVRREQIRRGEIGSFLNVTGADTTRALQRIAVEEARLHIPLLFALDVIHGLRTIFPVPLAEASSWDPPAVERAGR